MRYYKSMKKIITAILVLSILFSFSISAQDPGFILSGESLVANRGDTIAVKFCFNNNPGVSIISLNLDYDDDTLELTEIEGNSLMPGNFSGNTDEHFIFWCNYTGDVVYNGVAFTAFFFVKDNAHVGETTVSVSPAYCGGSILNNNYEDITLEIIDASIKIAANYLTGDINCDGDINSNDMLNLISILLERSSETENCDITGDGNIDVIDLIALKKILINS